MRLLGVCFLAMALSLALPGAAPAQEEPRTEQPQTEEAQGSKEPQADEEDDPQVESFLETITVTATRGERSVKDVPGSVSVIDADRIENEVVNDVRDLVRYEPGVYVANSAERLGAGGFNIRGVGGNRVLTRVDGIPTAEEFSFGHFDVPSYAIDLDALDRLEILRGPASSLYGSDALGGVVSFYSKDPIDYLGADNDLFVGLRGTYDSRFDEIGEALTLALGSDEWQFSGVVTHSAGGERDNQGDIHTTDSTRTAANPQERRHLGLLAKVSHPFSDSNNMQLAFEALDRTAETEVMSAQGSTNLGAIFGLPPFITWVVDKPSVTGRDEQQRFRLSLEQSLTGSVTDHLLWRVYLQSNDTRQETDEIRSTTRGGGPLGPLTTVDILREGLLVFEQESFGGEAIAHQEFELGGAQLLTFGVNLAQDRFDQLRDRVQTDIETGQGVESADGLHFPTKYFPESRVTEVGLYAQAEIDVAGDRVTLVPGLRYDYFDLSIDKNDSIYLSGNLGTPDPVESTESALSPKLGVLASVSRNLVVHAQYAHGFRAPPYSAINSGFTHLAGGQTRLPNPDLVPETSDGFELGLRGTWARGGWGVTGYTTDYENFIELVKLGENPETGLVEFQQQNVAKARISGIEASVDYSPARGWMLRSALAWSEGEDRTRSVPLNSIHPPELVLGLRRDFPGPGNAESRWHAEIVGRLVAAKDRSDIDGGEEDQVATPSYQLLDIYVGWDISSSVGVNAGLLNLFDETYWEWTDALGRPEGSPTLDRYTGPGRSVTISLRYRMQ